MPRFFSSHPIRIIPSDTQVFSKMKIIHCQDRGSLYYYVASLRTFNCTKMVNFKKSTNTFWEFMELKSVWMALAPFCNSYGMDWIGGDMGECMGWKVHLELIIWGVFSWCCLQLAGHWSCDDGKRSQKTTRSSLYSPLCSSKAQLFTPQPPAPSAHEMMMKKMDKLW